MLWKCSQVNLSSLTHGCVLSALCEMLLVLCELLLNVVAIVSRAYEVSRKGKSDPAIADETRFQNAAQLREISLGTGKMQIYESLCCRSF